MVAVIDLVTRDGPGATAKSRIAQGELVGAGVGVAGALPVVLGTGNANVGDGDAAGVVDMPGGGDCAGEDVDVGLGDEEGVGVGGGGIIFSQRCSGTVAPPISSASFWQRA